MAVVPKQSGKRLRREKKRRRRKEAGEPRSRLLSVTPRPITALLDGFCRVKCRLVHRRHPRLAHTHTHTLTCTAVCVFVFGCCALIFLSAVPPAFGVSGGAVLPPYRALVSRRGHGDGLGCSDEGSRPARRLTQQYSVILLSVVYLYRLYVRTLQSK